AVSTSRCAPAQSATSSPLTTASPPAALMASTTSDAGEAEAPVPSSSAPMSLTTTRAPWRANSSACARPMPRPAPVTMTTRPSQIIGRESGRPTIGRMHYGVTLFVTDKSIGILELAKAVEERGLDSLWLPEPTHIPTSRKTPYPGAADGVLPEEYHRCLDPFVALTAAAIAAPALRVGTGIMLVAQRDPIVTAKDVAT